MAAQEFEVECPRCKTVFDVASGTAEGQCPGCSSRMRFEEPEPSATAAVAAPASTQDGGASSRNGSTFAPAPPGPDEFGVECPSCTVRFNVGEEAIRGSCPGCQAQLVFENQYADHDAVFSVACPSCSGLLEVRGDATTGQCPSCRADLRFEDRFWDGPSAPAPPFPPPNPLPPPGPDPMPPPGPTPGPEPDDDPDDDSASVASAATPGADDAATRGPPPAEVGRDASPPAATPTSGSHNLTCPSCSKEFSVGDKDREGNCPHCNAPLAFLSQREYEQLLLAEERRKALQEKLKRKRLERQQREEAAAARRAAKAGRSWSPFRRAAAPEGSPATTQAPAEPSAPVEKRGLFRRRKTEEPATPSAAPAQAPVAEPSTPQDVAPSTAPQKKGRKWFGKKEERPTEAAPPPVAEAAPEAAATPPTPAKQPRRLGLFGRRPPPPAQETVAAPEAAPAAVVVESEILIEASAPTTVAVESARPKRFNPFRRKDKQLPGPAAVVEDAGIEIGGLEAGEPSSSTGGLEATFEVEAAPPPPSAPPKKAGKKRAKK